MLSINGVSLPSPTSLSVQVVSRSGISQYNLLGKLVRDGVQEKRLLQISWARMPADALASLSALLQPGDFVTLSYPDPLSGPQEIRCFCADRSARVCQYRHGEALWADVKLTLEEQ